MCLYLQVEALDEYHDGVLKANEDKGITNRRAYLMGVLKRLHNEVTITWFSIADCARQQIVRLARASLTRTIYSNCRKIAPDRLDDGIESAERPR